MKAFPYAPAHSAAAFAAAVLALVLVAATPAFGLATFSSQTPAPGSTVSNLQGGITVIATTSPNQIAQSIPRGFFVDGVQRGAYGSYITQYKETIYGPISTAEVPDGLHTVRMYTTELLGLRTETSWSFTLQAPPTLTEAAPANGSVTPYARPRIGLNLFDNTPGPVHVHLRVDGALVFDGQANQGDWSWTPTTPFANNSVHFAIADVTDAAGNAANVGWSFTVTAGDAMATTCVECHTSYPNAHPMGNCEACHGYGDYHGIGWAPTRAGACLGCHDPYEYHGPDLLHDCTSCHSPDWPDVRMHDAADMATYHAGTTSGCSPCHDSSLVVEHSKYPSGDVFKYQCTTCHDNTASDVTGAIQNGRTDCWACHSDITEHPHPEATVATTPVGDQVCGMCHSMDLVAEHGKSSSSSAADPCDACHLPGGARDSVGTWNGGCSQPACHGEGTPRAVHKRLCDACHAEERGADFNTHSSVDFEAPSVDLTRCAACHWKAGHFEHGNDRQCNSCHYALPARTQTYASVVPTAWGWFSSAASIAQSPEVLHAVHANGSWPQGVAKSPANGQPTDCVSCHAPAACDACHDETTPHGPHTKADAAYPARSYKVAKGKAAGSGVLDTTQTRSVTCAASACHDLGEAAAACLETRAEEASFAYSGSWWTTASSYASGGAMRYASKPGSVVTVSVNGPGSLRVYGRKDPYSGRMRVSIDGGEAQVVDLYSGSTAWKSLLFDTGPLGEGLHTLRIEPDGTRNASALGSKVQIDYALTLKKTAARFTPDCDSCHADRAEVHW